ncbi:zinc cluster transcription factor [Salix suchowensis]|nr:zinc cluster transcription factor [Salix suchowensis]
MNAIYLWACFISRPEPLCQHEEHYLARALEVIGEAIRLGNHALDVIQASCLLSMYFLSNGRMLEGSYHASAAVGLAVQCGLHRGISLDSQSWILQSTDSFDIKPVKDLSESERVLTFWQVFNLDRCWAVIMRRPSMIPDGPDGWNSIITPWPLDTADYEAGQMHQGNSYLTVRSFLNGDVSGGYSTRPLVLRQLLFSTAPTRLCRTGILLDAASPEDKTAIIVAHTLAQATIIHLYRRFAQSDGVSYAKCLRAAHTSLLDRCGRYLDAGAEQSRNILAFDEQSDVRNEIGVLLYAVTSLGSRFPLLAEQQNQPGCARSIWRPLRDRSAETAWTKFNSSSNSSNLTAAPPATIIRLPAESPGSRLERSSTCRRVSRTTTQ